MKFQQEAAFSKLTNEFQIKPAHETEQSTVEILNIGTFILHIVNCILFGTAVLYSGLSGFKMYALMVLLGAFSIFLELLKRKKMAVIANYSLLANDDGQPQHIRKQAYDEHTKQKPFLVMLWAVSAVGVILSGAGMAKKLTPEIVEAKENAAFQKALDVAISNLSKAQENGAGVTTLKQLQGQINQAKTDLAKEKESVQTFNEQNNAQNQNTLYLYMFGGLIIGILLEGLTAAAVFALQRKKYEIVQSLQSKTPKSDLVPNTPILEIPKAKGA